MDIIESVRDNDDTVVVAGNKLGKDFIAGYICLWFFLTRHPVRVITTSVKDDHLRVLWGEIGDFVQKSKVPLSAKDGGPLTINHREITKVTPGTEEKCAISYLRGMVSEKGEGMAGHHAAYTLGVVDEASGVDDVVFKQMETWAEKRLIFGNPNSCSNTFYKAVEEGDILAEDS